MTIVSGPLFSCNNVGISDIWRNKRRCSVPEDSSLSLLRVYNPLQIRKKYTALVYLVFGKILSLILCHLGDQGYKQSVYIKGLLSYNFIYINCIILTSIEIYSIVPCTRSI